MGRRNRVLVSMIAVLLPAGGVAAATVDPGGPGPAGGRIGATGFAQEAVAEGGVAAPVTATTSTTAPPATVSPRPLPLPSTTVPRSTATTVRPASTTPPTLLPLLPGVGPTTTVAPVSQPTNWSRSANGVTVRMRMEPAAPVAGRPVRFLVDDVSAPDGCCIVHMSFGDGTATPLTSGGCESPNTRTGMVTTHTFAAPGAYEVHLIVATFPCPPPTVVGGQIAPPPITGTDIRACIAVGPGTVPSRCAPVEHFGPPGG